MTALAPALDALVLAGSAAGLDAAAVRDEGARLAAAVAESITGAGPDWLAATGTSGGLESFFTAASSARRWRSGPTDHLAALVRAGSDHAPAYARALTEVVSAASALGDPGIGGIAAASATAAAQLAAIPQREAPRAPAAPTAPADSLFPAPDLLPQGVPGVDEILARCAAPSTTGRRTSRADRPRPPPPRPPPRGRSPSSSLRRSRSTT
ncbi:hypothetical protein [Rathayibacter sp. VKM Ac-2630]|uniref:hypothetical protein n=1 Tax=Rathayibacter sp. VKM Ac-2630 TaxID=1938617 RepID=UPI0009D4A7E6|nr:hypothetical protein [Rathayibacter sp. VKM Ac-2630]OOB89299.1 hypothetical protein B0T42_18300 [Rathayibacter sp. VKM Ac-2630]